MTLRELSIRLTGASWRREYAAKSDLRLAWHVAMLSRVKEIPDLSELLGTDDPAQSEEIKGKLQRAAWIDWAIARGIPIVKHDHPVM